VAARPSATASSGTSSAGTTPGAPPGHLAPGLTDPGGAVGAGGHRSPGAGKSGSRPVNGLITPEHPNSSGRDDRTLRSCDHGLGRSNDPGLRSSAPAHRPAWLREGPCRTARKYSNTTAYRLTRPHTSTHLSTDTPYCGWTVGGSPGWRSVEFQADGQWVLGLGAQVSGMTPRPARASARRWLSPLVWTRWAWCRSGSTVAVARVLGMMVSKPLGWMLLVTATDRRS
jgi:hypothetical protein